jgi:hypothetical protein
MRTRIDVCTNPECLDLKEREPPGKRKKKKEKEVNMA